jgi:hypothetical protein
MVDLRVKNFMKQVSALILAVFLLVSFGRAQVADINLQIPEPFFDAMLDSIFRNADPPEYPLVFNNSDFQIPNSETLSSIFQPASFMRRTNEQTLACRETIKLQRQMDGVKTAIRFRGGQITAPIAFTGNYNPPFIGCVDFAGIADTVITLEFNESKQSLIGRVRVTNVRMSGTGGIGSGVLARMVQNSIDKKVNPIQLLTLDKISFLLPIHNAGNVRLKAKSVRHELADGFINIRVFYEFQ